MEKVFPEYDNVQFIVNYDFIVEEQPLKLDEIAENESVEVMTLCDLLAELEEQDRII